MAITLKINNLEVTVPKGSTILDAAEKIGVYIPTLCHDKRIAPAGACRLCIVADRKRPDSFLPSCFTPVRDGMDIITTSPAIEEAIREQLKLILINHPLDCPVCDKAGECVLQELVIRYGVTGAPYALEAPFRPVDHDSPLIARDMNRCVLCGRCVRICADLQGKGELEFIQRGYRTYIGTDGGRKLDCDFCGLCISTCPVGALTDKLFKNATRVWKLEKRRTVCSHCGLGCPIDMNMEGNVLRRVTAPLDSEGRENLLCVRGRFGWRAFADHNRRPVGPQLRDDRGRRDVPWEEALSFAARRIAEVCESHGGASVAALTADLLTTEEAAAYGEFFRSVVGSDSVASVQAAGYRRLTARLEAILPGRWNPPSWDETSAADILLVLGGGAAEFHPVLKPLINGYLKKEGKELIVISTWADYFFKRATLPIAVAPGLLDEFLGNLQAVFSGDGQGGHTDASRYGVHTGKLARLIALLHGEREIAILVVPDLYGHDEARASLAASLNDRVRGILPLGGQFNSRGAMVGGFVSASGRDFNDILVDMEGGHIRALYLIGEDPLDSCPDPERVRAALTGLDLLICQSPYETAATELAHIVLPTALPTEKAGSVLSLAGETQALPMVMTGPAGVRADGEILGEIVRLMGREEKMTARPGAAGQAAAGASPDRPAGIVTGRVAADATTRGEGPDIPASAPDARGVPPESFTRTDCRGEGPSPEFPWRLLPVPSLFGDSIINRQSPELADLRKGLTVVMGNDDFEALGLAEKETVAVCTPGGAVRAVVRSAARVARGTALLLHSAGSPEGLSLLRGGETVVPAAIVKIAC